MLAKELTERVAALEKTVDDLQRQLKSLGQATGPWWVDQAGRFANDPVFDEMIELGREYRASLRPRKQKVKRDRS
jgi:hypothetical protein